MRTRKIFFGTIVAVAFLACGMVAARPAQQPTAAPPGQSPATEDESVIKASFPRMLWSDERIVSAKIPGRIDKRLVDDGSAVEVNQVIAKLDSREADLENLRQKMIADSDLAEKIAKETYEEYLARRDANDRLVQTRAIPYEEWRLGIVQVTINKYKMEQEIEKASIEKNKADQTQIILDEHMIRSPIKGRVQKCFKRAKESVTPNDLQMFRIVATDKLWVDGQVDDANLFRVREGQRVTVQPVFWKNRSRVQLPESDMTFEGKVIFIDTDVDPNSHKFIVRAEIENRRDILRAGMDCEMRIYVNSSSAAKSSD